MFMFLLLSIESMSTLAYIAFWVVVVVTFWPTCWISSKVAHFLVP